LFIPEGLNQETIAMPISETEKGPVITLPAPLPDAIDSVVVLEIQGDK
jgi:hypothetical protein